MVEARSVDTGSHRHPPETGTDSRRGLREERPSGPLNVAIVGGGEACRHLLELLNTEHLSRLGMTLHGVSDPDPKAPAFSWPGRWGM